MIEILVHRETRRIGGDLEEHSTGLLEVDRVEPEPVDHRRGLRARRQDPLPYLELLFVIGDAEGHVVDGAGAPLPAPLPRQLADLQPLARASSVNAEAMPAGLLASGLEAEGFPQEARGHGQLPLPEPHRVEAADLV